MPVLGLPTALESSLNDLLQQSPATSWKVSGRGCDVTVVIKWNFGCDSPGSDKTLDCNDDDSIHSGSRHKMTSAAYHWRRTPVSPYTTFRRHGLKSRSPSIGNTQQCTPDSGRESSTTYPKHEINFFGDDNSPDSDESYRMPANQESPPVPYFLVSSENMMQTNPFRHERGETSACNTTTTSQALNTIEAGFADNGIVTSHMIEDQFQPEAVKNEINDSPCQFKEMSSCNNAGLRNGIRAYLSGSLLPGPSSDANFQQPVSSGVYQMQSASDYHNLMHTNIIENNIIDSQIQQMRNIDNRSSESGEISITEDCEEVTAASRRRNFRIFRQHASLPEENQANGNEPGRLLEIQNQPRSPDCSGTSMTTDHEMDASSTVNSHNALVDIVVCSSESNSFEGGNDMAGGGNFHGWEVLEFQSDQEAFTGLQGRAEVVSSKADIEKDVDLNQ